MITPLFSTYSQGENRVTATLLAVLERLSRPNAERVIGTLLADENFRPVRYINQPRGPESTPDAKIEFGYSVWIETKTSRDAVDVDQIRRHLKAVADNEKLLVLTPDDQEPASLGIGRLAKEYREKIVWTNFNTLDLILQKILKDEVEPPKEMEAFLIEELSSFLHKEGIAISSEERVMVVPAGRAWQRYCHELINGDVRGPNCLPSEYLAFYTGNQIKAIVPKIKSVKHINITNREEVKALDDQKQKVVNKLLNHHGKDEDWDHSLKVLFLSDPNDDTETIRLYEPIENDKIGKKGTRVALIQRGVTYVTLDSLRNSRYTSELIPC